MTGPATPTARVKVIAYDAALNSSEDVSDADFEIYDPAAGVTQREIPSRLVVVAGMPNPVTESTRIRFGLPAAGRVELDVFDVSGRKVSTLPSGLYSSGYHEVEWRPDAGSFGSGIYFLRVRFGQEEVTTKIVVWR
ncbi:MAG TPA: T9SS type A sorting domain-containing protein [bacterium]|nr:T9SS type A sorting domain-containing protein [bacterium]